MTVTAEMKREVHAWIGETLEKLDCVGLSDQLDVQWNNRFTRKIGDSRIEVCEARYWSRIRFSVKLWPRATPEQRRSTVIHEVCHLVCAYQAHAGGQVRPKVHGVEWGMLMRRCGVPPDRTHNVKCDDLNRRQWVGVGCECGGFNITPYIAGRIAAGVGYQCKDCHTKLEVPPGTKPVERRNRKRKKRRARQVMAHG